jgi:AcrR family transcriptional regulator
MQRAASRRSSLADERIREVAARHIARDGIDRVRLTEIVKDFGVSVSLIRYHFSTRDKLLGQALMQAYERAHLDRAKWEGAYGPASADERLADTVGRALPFPHEAQQGEWALWVERWSQAIRNAQLRPVAGDLYARSREWWMTWIGPGCDPGASLNAMPAALPTGSWR